MPSTQRKVIPIIVSSDDDIASYEQGLAHGRAESEMWQAAAAQHKADLDALRLTSAAALREMASGVRRARKVLKALI